MIPFKNTNLEIDLPSGKLTYPHFEWENTSSIRVHFPASYVTFPKDWYSKTLNITKNKCKKSSPKQPTFQPHIPSHLRSFFTDWTRFFFSPFHPKEQQEGPRHWRFRCEGRVVIHHIQWNPGISHFCLTSHRESKGRPGAVSPVELATRK